MQFIPLLFTLFSVFWSFGSFVSCTSNVSFIGVAVIVRDVSPNLILPTSYLAVPSLTGTDILQTDSLRPLWVWQNRVNARGGVPIKNNQFIQFNVTVFNIGVTTNVTLWRANIANVMSAIVADPSIVYVISNPELAVIDPYALPCEISQTCIVFSTLIPDQSQFICTPGSALWNYCVSKGKIAGQRIWENTINVLENPNSLVQTWLNLAYSRGYRSLGIVTSIGESILLPSVQAQASTLGITVNAVEIWPANPSSQTILQMVSNVVQTNPSLFLITAFSAEASIVQNIISVMKQLDWSPAATCIAGGAMNTLIKLIPNDVAHMFWTDPWNYQLNGQFYWAQDIPGNMELWPGNSTLASPAVFRADMESQFPDTFDALLPGLAIPVISGIVIIKQLENVGLPNPTISELLIANDKIYDPSHWGLISFNTFRQIVDSPRVVEQVSETGTVNIVYPPGLGPEAIFPSPTWDQRSSTIFFSIVAETVVLSIGLMTVLSLITLILIDRALSAKERNEFPTLHLYLGGASFLYGLGTWGSSIIALTSLSFTNQDPRYTSVTYISAYEFGAIVLMLLPTYVSFYSVLMTKREDSYRVSHNNNTDVTRSVDSDNTLHTTSAGNEETGTEPPLVNKCIKSVISSFLSWRLYVANCLLSGSIQATFWLVWSGLTLAATKTIDYRYVLGGVAIGFLVFHFGLWSLFHVRKSYSRFGTALLVAAAELVIVYFNLASSIFSRNNVNVSVSVTATILTIVVTSLLVISAVFWLILNVIHLKLSKDVLDTHLLNAQRHAQQLKRAIVELRVVFEQHDQIGRILQSVRPVTVSNDEKRNPQLQHPVLLDALQHQETKHKHKKSVEASILPVARESIPNSIADAVSPLNFVVHLEDVLHNTICFELLKDQAHNAHNLDPLMFLTDVQLYQDSEEDGRIQMSRYISQTYLDINAPCALNIQDEDRKRLFENCHRGTHQDGVFQSAQAEAIRLVRTNNWPRFQESPAYDICKTILSHQLNKPKLSLQTIQTAQKCLAGLQSVKLSSKYSKHNHSRTISLIT